MSGGQQSLTKLGFSRVVPLKVPTAEQQRIIQHQLAADHLVKIVAFAGTGKTSTLVKMAEANPHLKFLLVVYNKSVREAAQQIFPSNVVCKTAHSMAWSKCGFAYGKKMTPNLKAKDIHDCDLLSLGGRGSDSLYRRSGQVLECLTNFLNCPDQEVGLEQVPQVWRVGQREEQLSPQQRTAVLADTRAVWAAMIDKENMKIRMSHDGYLKLWQLRRPDLQRVSPHQVLLLDEGQDMNPTMLDIFNRQSVARVIVGDPHQQIYSFRGAVNALDLLDPTHTFYLTQSFRFGPEIALLANQCLISMKGENMDTKTLVGGRKDDSITGERIEENKVVAFIARTNFGLFSKLKDLVTDEKINKKIGLVGGLDNYNLDDYLDLCHLMQGNKHKMKKYKNFFSFNAFEKFASNVNDIELLSKIKVVKTWGSKLPSIIDKIRRIVCKDIRAAEIVLSTTHKAKGLEFETVVMLDDFAEYKDQSGLAISLKNLPEDEKNLIYVAITRAKSCLVVNKLVDKEILSPASNMIIKVERMNMELEMELDFEEEMTVKKCDNLRCKEVIEGQFVMKTTAYRSYGECLEGDSNFCNRVIGKMREMLYYCSECSAELMPHFEFVFGIDPNRGVTRKRFPRGHGSYQLGWFEDADAVVFFIEDAVDDEGTDEVEDIEEEEDSEDGEEDVEFAENMDEVIIEAKTEEEDGKGTKRQRGQELNEVVENYISTKKFKKDELYEGEIIDLTDGELS